MKCLSAGMDISKGRTKATRATGKSKSIDKVYKMAYDEVFQGEEILNLLLHGHCKNAVWTQEHTEAFLKVLQMHSECLIRMTSKLDFATHDLNRNAA